MGWRDLPTGTVTFLFTDVEGSTRLLTELGEAAYAKTLADHRRLLRDAFAAQGGIEVDTEGDAVFAAFPTAPGALDAAGNAQSALGSGPLRVRMGVHTGTPLRTEEGYVGVDVHRAARICAAGHGGQVLVSSATAALVDGDGVSLIDLGEHRLKDLAGSERIYQLGSQSFPRLKSLSPTNLPTPAGAFVGRRNELHELGELLRDPSVRLVTLFGTGGIGKTRLALEAAAAAEDDFPDGRWWVPLASITGASTVPAATAQALGLVDSGAASQPPDLAAYFSGRRALLILDNAEHLMPGIADVVAELLPASGGSTVLVTSRDRLHLQAERVFDVPALTSVDAENLLVARAAAVGITLSPSEAVTTLCERLDRLPLALQLAAARLPILSVEQLLERLSSRLDLFSGGRDLDPRQRTLRATIEWSHELLSGDEQALFQRLAVFRGGATLEAVEAVGGGGLEALQGLVDKSLLQRRDEGSEPRFSMLESIAQFAAERLAASGEEYATRDRHAAWFRGFAERVDERLQSGEPEERWVALLEPEIDNLRAAVALGLETGDLDLVRSIGAALPMLWIVRGRLAEGRAWVEQALAVDSTPDDTRRRLLSGAATLAYLQGDYREATAAADEAAALASALGPDADRLTALKQRARGALMNEDFSTAESLYREALEAAIQDDNGVGISSCRINLAYVANRTGRHDVAESWLAQNLPFVRGRGQARCEATTLVSLGETYTYLDRPAEAVEHLVEATSVTPRAGDPMLLVEGLRWYASAIAALGDAERAALLLGACEAAEVRMEAALEPFEQAVRDELIDVLGEALSGSDLAALRERGRSLDLDTATRLVLDQQATQRPVAR